VSRFVLDQNGRRAQFGYSPKPSYRSDPNNANNIVVPAGETYPAYFNVGGSVYKVTSDLNCNVGVSGLGGLTSTVEDDTPYYLYAVLVNGKISLVGDKKPPTNGPSSYGDWTYVGAFCTETGPSVVPFCSNHGIAMSHPLTSGLDFTCNNATPSVAKTVVVPETATSVYLSSRFTAINAAGDGFTCGPTGTSPLVRMRGATATVGQLTPAQYWCPLLTAKTVYMNVSTATTDVVTTHPIGWQEAPWEFQ
jgi:hypothetical protein